MFDTPTFDFDFQEQPRDNRGRLQGDERLHVQFYTRAIENIELSKAESRKIFEDHEFIRIAIPGDQYTQVDTFATNEYKSRFPLDYKRFKANTTDTVVGTPIDLLPGLTPSQIAEFKSMSIRTVEDLAELPDSTKLMGIHELKRRAKGYLDLSREEAIATRAEETNTRLKAQEAALAQRDAEVAALKAQMEQLLSASTKKNKNTEA